MNPTIDSLVFKNIWQYQSCIDLVKDFIEKMKDDTLLTKLRENLSKLRR